MLGGLRYGLRSIILPVALLIAGCGDHRSSWDKIIASGELRFATIAGPATYYETPDGPAGFEFELARKFARKYGVDLKLVVARNSYDVISMVRYNKAAIGGAGLISINGAGDLESGPSYYSVPQQLIYRRGDTRPVDSPEFIPDSHEASLKQPEGSENAYLADWFAYYADNVNTLFRKVQHRQIPSAIASSYLVNIYKHIYPDIRVAFNITQPQPVAWVYRSDDPLLAGAVTEFFGELAESGELDRLIEHYFGHLVTFNYIDTSTFLTRITERLPRYEELFRAIGEKYNLDWTLLAAMSYQESHWLAEAKSPTGVRGLMMLTLDTARQLDVSDRTDPEQSIDGGARYFSQLMARIPERIAQPDRTWLALAAYNVGLQHLEHARVITQQQSGDPDRWRDVRKTLLALGEKSVDGELQAEGVRWLEPVHYVRNIRKYRDILRWLNFEKGKQAGKPELLHALTIDSPVL